MILALACVMVISVFAAEQASKEQTSTPAMQMQAANPQASTSMLKTEQDKVSYIIGTQIAQLRWRVGVRFDFLLYLVA